ncbi:MAG: hypothetical protein EXR77_02575 [Myxococcales bacterium]|nr:hypothetical protein [Myxococcales bacterium]
MNRRGGTLPAPSAVDGAWVLGVAVWAGLTACTTSNAPILDGLTSARALGAVCIVGTTLTHPNGCQNDGQLRALVGGGSRGTLAIGAPSSAMFVDTDPTVPGITGLALPGEPIAMAVDAVLKRAFVLVATNQPAVVSVDLTALPTAKLSIAAVAPLPFVPAAIVEFGRKINGISQPHLAVADPAGGQIWVTQAASFSATPTWQVWAVGGSPSALVWLPVRAELWVGHLHHSWVNRVVPETGGKGQVIAIDTACRNGLDDDGDGHIDRADRGCDSDGDTSETDPEAPPLCTNGLDDDGNGLFDAADVGCDLHLGTSTCRNGLDDDGDGKTDYVQDKGCADWSDSSEHSDNSACADGFDNDGDGKIDGLDGDCSAGSEWPAAAAGTVESLAAATACANGLDDDGDGLTDTDDPHCSSRSGQSEVGANRSPQAQLAATADDHVVAVAHQGRREVLFIDTASGTLLLPVRGDKSPYLRASRLDERDGVLGLTTGERPTALAGLRKTNGSAVAQLIEVATSPGGLASVQVSAGTQGVVSIQWLVAEAAAATTVGQPALVVGGVGQDLGASIPPRWAHLGPLRAQARPDGISYYGIQPNAQSLEHRSELWYAIHQGTVPGTQRTSGRWLGPTVMHDGTADFCELGVVAGDWLVLSTGSRCAAAQPLRVKISQVGADTLVLDSATATADTAVTTANQFSLDLGDPALVKPPLATLDTGCWSHGAVSYAVLTDGWLLHGTRTGVVSKRSRIGNQCAALPVDELNGARLPEPILRSDASGKPIRPASCPYVGGNLDPVFVPNPVNTPIFKNLQIQPGCRTRSLTDGKVAVQVLPSVRGATWAFTVAAGSRPFVSPLGSETTALVAADKLTYVYALDAGGGALFAVDPTGVNKSIRIE